MGADSIVVLSLVRNFALSTSKSIMTISNCSDSKADWTLKWRTKKKSVLILKWNQNLRQPRMLRSTTIIFFKRFLITSGLMSAPWAYNFDPVQNSWLYSINNNKTRNVFDRRIFKLKVSTVFIFCFDIFKCIFFTTRYTHLWNRNYEIFHRPNRPMKFYIKYNNM